MSFNHHGLYFDLQFHTSVFPLGLNISAHHSGTVANIRGLISYNSSLKFKYIATQP